MLIEEDRPFCFQAFIEAVLFWVSGFCTKALWGSIIKIIIVSNKCFGLNLLWFANWLVFNGDQQLYWFGKCHLKVEFNSLRNVLSIINMATGLFVFLWEVYPTNQSFFCLQIEYTHTDCVWSQSIDAINFFHRYSSLTDFKVWCHISRDCKLWVNFHLLFLNNYNMACNQGQSV